MRPPLPFQKLQEKDAVLHDKALRPLLCVLTVSSRVLRLSMETRFTASILLHRYFHYRNASSERISIQNEKKHIDEYREIDGVRDGDSEWTVTVAGCLFLACKICEEPRRLRDVINCAHMIKWKRVEIDVEAKKIERARQPLPQTKNMSKVGADKDGQNILSVAMCPPAFQEDANVNISWNPNPPDLDEAYWKSKEKMVAVEQKILRWLAFDTTISHPHRAVVIFAEHQNLQHQMDNMSRKEKCRDKLRMILVDRAWQWVNTAIFSVQVLQASIAELAAAALDLAIEDHYHAQNYCVSGYRVTNWWESLAVTEKGLSATKVKLKGAAKSLE